MSALGDAKDLILRARQQAAYGNNETAALLYAEAQVFATLAVVERLKKDGDR